MVQGAGCKIQPTWPAFHPKPCNCYRDCPDSYREQLDYVRFRVEGARFTLSGRSSAPKPSNCYRDCDCDCPIAIGSDRDWTTAPCQLPPTRPPPSARQSSANETISITGKPHDLLRLKELSSDRELRKLGWLEVWLRVKG